MLSNSDLYHIRRARLAQLAPDSCKTRLTHMVLLVVGLYKAGSVHLSEVARKLPVRSEKLSLDKQLRRFLGNGTLRVRDCYRPVAVALLKTAASAGQVRLIVDSSRVGFGHRFWSFAVTVVRF